MKNKQEWASQGKVEGNEIFNRRFNGVFSDPLYQWYKNHSGYLQCLFEKHLKCESNSSSVSENRMNLPQQ